MEERYQSEESSGDVGLTPSAVSEVGFDRSVDAVAVMAAAAAAAGGGVAVAAVTVAAVAVVAVAVVAAIVAVVGTFSVTSVFEPASILLQ